MNFAAHPPFARQKMPILRLFSEVKLQNLLPGAAK